MTGVPSKEPPVNFEDFLVSLSDQQRGWWELLLSPEASEEEKSKANQWLEDEGL